jgi:hypothetical protein
MLVFNLHIIPSISPRQPQRDDRGKALALYEGDGGRP